MDRSIRGGSVARVLATIVSSWLAVAGMANAQECHATCEAFCPGSPPWCVEDAPPGHCAVCYCAVSGAACFSAKDSPVLGGVGLTVLGGTLVVAAGVALRRGAEEESHDDDV